MKINKEEIIVYIKQNLKTILIALVASILLVCAGIYYINDNSAEEYNIPTQNQNTSEPSSSKESPKEDENIVVDVKGAIKNPGVYNTTKNKRIKDIIEEAGGLLEEADTTTINLSQKLRDQMVVYIPKKGEKVKTSFTDSSSDKKVININTASKEELQKISGIGKTKAEAIEKYREEKGEFKTKEEIMKVKGIGKGTFDKIKEEIEV